MLEAAARLLRDSRQARRDRCGLAVDAGAGVTGGTGSGRSGVGSLPPVSFGASTLAVSDLAVSLRFPWQSLGVFGLALDGRLGGSGLSPSALAASTLAVSRLAHRFLRASLALPPRTSRLFAPGLPRLPSFCLPPDLLVGRGLCRRWPSAGLGAVGRRIGAPAAWRPGPFASPSALRRRVPRRPAQASCAGAAGCSLRPKRSSWSGLLRASPPAWRPCLLHFADLSADPCLIPCIGSRRSRPGRRTAPRPCRWRWYNAGAGSRAAMTPARSSTGHAGLLWQAVQVPAKIWEGLLPASRLVACACADPAAKQPIRSVTVAKLSARLNIPCFSRCGIASSVTQHTAGGGHLLADYPANGSALMTHLRDCHIWEYPL